MLARVIAGRGDERDPAGGGKRSAAAAIAELCDVYTQSGLEGSWTELLQVYDRRNDDSLREILALSAPSVRVNDLNGWHLERMAVDEYGAGAGAGRATSGVDDVAAIRRETRRVRQIVNSVLATGRGFQARRDALVAAMARQREALTTELDAAKDFLGQTHLAGVTTDPTAVGLSAPAPVEQRLLATVKAPEEAASVDLSAAPAI